jgi:hypothetical protein
MGFVYNILCISIMNCNEGSIILQTPSLSLSLGSDLGENFSLWGLDMPTL